MHNFLKKYYFIRKFDKAHLIKLNKKIELIYRNHDNPNDIQTIRKITQFCKRNNRKFYISNNVKLAIKFRANGVYLSAFNKSLRHNCFKINKKFNFIGSAHNITEINHKIKQKVNTIFLCPVFKNKRKILGIYGFNKLSKLSKVSCVVLGGVNSANLRRIGLTDAFGFAGIDYFNKKKGP